MAIWGGKWCLIMMYVESLKGCPHFEKIMAFLAYGGCEICCEYRLGRFVKTYPGRFGGYIKQQAHQDPRTPQPHAVHFPFLCSESYGASMGISGLPVNPAALLPLFHEHSLLLSR